MNLILCSRGPLLCFLGLMTEAVTLPAAAAEHGNVQVSAQVWELDAAPQLTEIEPIARHLQAKPAPLSRVPNPRPMLPGMTTVPVVLPAAECLKILRNLETDFGAKSHPADSRTVSIGEEIAFTIPLATEKVEMRVQTVLRCRLRDEVILLASFPDAARPVNPIMDLGSQIYSSDDRSYLVCRTEEKGTLLHHTLILLEERHYGVSGRDSVTETRNLMQRLVLPATHLENLTSLQLLEWLVRQSREEGKSSRNAFRRGLNVVWRQETAEDVRNSYPLGIDSLLEKGGMTLREAVTLVTELGQMTMGIDPHAAVLHVSSSSNECSPGEMLSRQFRVKPQILTRFQDRTAINTAASASNLPIYLEGGGGFTLDREHLILTYHQPPEDFPLAEKWLQDQRLLNTTPAPVPSPPAALARAGKIILPHLDLRRANLSEAVKAIQQAGEASSPPVKNLRIVIQPGAQEENFITMFTRDMPADEALRHCARLSYRRIEADDTTITLRPLTEP